jgi:endonuclease YncB( thermonuclease family)
LRAIGGALGGVLLILVGVVLIYRQSTKPTPLNFSSGGKVKRISGDHLSLSDGRHIELAGIRLPYETEPEAAGARTTLETWVKEKKIRLVFDENKAFKKNRLTSYVYAGDELINEKLVRQGLAFVKLREGQRRFEKELLDAQSEAIAESRGIWNSIKASCPGRFVVETDRATFHATECKGLFGKANRLEIENTADAYKQGFAPCGMCRPCSVEQH